MSSYNPERGTFEGSGESAAYGGGVGGLVQAIIDLVIPGRFSKKTSIGEADTAEKAGVDDDYGEGPFPVVGRFESTSRDENLPMVVDAVLPATQQPIVATPEETLGLEGPEERLGLPAPAPVEEGEETDGTKLLTVDTGTGTGDGSGDLAWLEAQGSDVELRVPKALYHLTMDQWEEVCQILMLLQYQQETSVIH